MTYLKTFLSVFVILMLIFLLQTIWLYISELAGKDLDAGIIFRFLLYMSPKLIPLVLPLTILVTSIMVFGNFAEKYEFAAMKSNGISLQRAMRGVMVFILLLSAVTFYFANDVIPWSEYKSVNLRRNIAQLKPTVAITEGQFNDIGDINIKVDKKSGDRGQYLSNVIIHKKKTEVAGNKTVIKANKGEILSRENSNTLSLVLIDGNYYDEIHQRDPHKRNRRPFTKSYFERYTINIDLSEFNNVDLTEEQDLSNEKMFKTNELRYEIDSMSRHFSSEIKNFPENVYIRSGISTLSSGFTPGKNLKQKPENLIEIFTIGQKRQLYESALNNLNNTIQNIIAKETDYKRQEKRLNKFEIALHEKYAMAAACIILFFVGAPLGAIIRKGGMGLPMVVAIVLFLAYHFIGIFAKNSAENAKLTPFIGSWFSTFIMLPLGIWLTYRATTDQGIFDADDFLRSISKFFKKIVRK
ncbi:MAG TPA: LptF/LptG family permease [Flavobacteriaceae bacterium]|nr:LptF/LptG family permease [Flavobacteriaceae bacterium]